jgi:hypothetical protein
MIRQELQTSAAMPRIAEIVCQWGSAQFEEKQRLDQEEEQLRNQWKNIIALIITGLRVVNAKAIGVPDKPTSQFVSDLPPGAN